MKISSDLVGTTLKDHIFDVEWRNTMNYAAAVEDDNSVYFDDEQEGGIVAHPMFPVTTTWPIFSNLPDFDTSGIFPFELMMTVVHYSEHIFIHRLLKPQERIFLKSKIVSILPHRAGTHIIACIDATDRQNNPIFTEFIGGMLRGVECLGGARGENLLPSIDLPSNSSEPIWREQIKIDTLRSFIYDACSNISSPIHTSKEFAHQVGLPNIIMQGTATLAYAIKTLINREAERNPLNVKEIACKFTGMVIPGTTIDIVLKNKEAN
ncbi:MAG: MaoC/PaaZ C-terminal domain-containing protein, partial [Candidatus Hodarchaeales archaeon]